MPIAADKVLNGRMRAAPYHRDLIEYLERELASERDAYETSPADEGRRQRVLVLRELIDALKE